MKFKSVSSFIHGQHNKIGTIIIIIMMLVIGIGILVGSQFQNEEVTVESQAAYNSPDNCVDSDATEEHPNGKNFFEKGTVTSGISESTDYCFSGLKKLSEVWCDPSGGLNNSGINVVWHECEFNCDDGRCTGTPPTVTPTPTPYAGNCDDTDDGLNYYEKGSVVTDEDTVVDQCLGGKLFEGYCDDSTWWGGSQKRVTCPGDTVCRDGKCVDNSGPTNTPASSPTNRPSATPTPSPTVSPTASPTTEPSTPPTAEPTVISDNCPRRSEGDADCNDEIEHADYFCWNGELKGNKPTDCISADFDENGMVDAVDIVRWRNTYIEEKF